MSTKTRRRMAQLIQIIIFDTTLRDGEQCPGASMNPRQKLEVARQLSRLKVPVIEAGFPVSSDGDFQSVQMIAREVKGPIICALARCITVDIEAAAKALRPAGKKARIHVFVGTSPTHRVNLHKTQDQVLEMAIAGVKLARTHVEDVEFSAMDATRTERDFLLKICESAILAGATTINIPDTVGYLVPSEMATLVSLLCSKIEALRNGKVILSVHCHNDLGMATANSLAAIRAGARQVECTINGIGERAGNAALEEVAMAIQTRADHFGFSTGIVTQEIVRTSRLVASVSGLSVQRSKAVVGENAFAHASGIHQDGQLKNRNSFEIMNPKDIGLIETDLPLTKHSGRAAVSVRLKHLGFSMTTEEVDAVFSRFKEIGDKKKFVYDDDLSALVSGQIAQAPETWSLEYLHVSGGTHNPPTATVRLKNCKGMREDAANGDGPVDAVFRSIDRVVGTVGKIFDYAVRAVSPGKEAVGEVTLEVNFGNGTNFKGRSADTDVITASARAYLGAVNRFLQIQKIGKGK